MADFIQFTAPIKPLGASTFAILEDKFIKGGFRIVETKDELDTLDPTTIKKGMLVAVNAEKGAIYECTDFSQTEDEFGDPVVSTIFTPLQVNSGTDPNAPAPSAYVRPKKVINFAYVSPGDSFDIPVNMGCQSFILTQLKVSSGRKLKVKIYTSAAKTDPIVFEFNSTKKNYMDGSTYLKNNARFQYKKCHIFVNKEVSPSQRKTFVVNCQSLEDSVYYTSKGLSYSVVQVELTYIPLET